MEDRTNIHIIAGRRLADLRRARGISQEEVAELIGVQPETISRYETAARHMSLDVLDRLARLFKVPISALVPDLVPDAEPNLEAELVDRWRRLAPSSREALLVVLRGMTR